MKNIDDTRDFMYYLFKAFFEQEKKNDGWVGYDELLEYMEKQDYAVAFSHGMEEFYVTYIPDYDSLNIFEERQNAAGDLELRLNHGFDAAALRRSFELFNMPYRITEDGSYKDKYYGSQRK